MIAFLRHVYNVSCKTKKTQLPATNFEKVKKSLDKIANDQHMNSPHPCLNKTAM